MHPGMAGDYSGGYANLPTGTDALGIGVPFGIGGAKAPGSTAALDELMLMVIDALGECHNTITVLENGPAEQNAVTPMPAPSLRARLEIAIHSAQTLNKRLHEVRNQIGRL